MKISQEDQSDLLIYAFRYTLGRCTYAPHTVISVLIENWGVIPAHDRARFKREIREAIKQSAAGHACDEKAWRKILELKE